MELFVIKRDTPPQTRKILKVASFFLPLAIWSAISYIPFLWHPMVKITDPGDLDPRYFNTGTLIERGRFLAQNEILRQEGKQLAKGDRANEIFLPAPHEVGKAFFTAFTTEPRLYGEPWLHESLWHSMGIIFWGFTFSVLIGVPLGIVCGVYPFFSRLFEPFIDFFRYMPAPAFAALLVALFGIYDPPKIALVFLGTFVQMVLVLANTTRKLEMSLVETAQTLGAKRFQLIFKVAIPSILPNLYRDLRILLGWAWTWLIVAEFIGTKTGISSFIHQQAKYKNFDNVFAAIIIIGIIGFLTDQILAFCGRRLFPWEQWDTVKA